MRKLLLVALFFVFTPLTLFSSVLSLMSVTAEKAYVQNGQTLGINSPKLETRIYAPLGAENFPSISSEIIVEDARTEILERYLKKNNSELLPHTDFIVQMADKYSLDYRLLPAIAQKESGLCRRIPHGSHNCWGWGIHSKGTLMFGNYEEAIETVSKGLKEKYIDLGYITPDQIMKKYAHPDSTTWADGVKMYMSQLE